MKMKWVIIALLVFFVPFVYAQDNFFSNVMSYFGIDSNESSSSQQPGESQAGGAADCELARLESIAQSVSNAEDLEEARSAGKNMLVILSTCSEEMLYSGNQMQQQGTQQSQGTQSYIIEGSQLSGYSKQTSSQQTGMQQQSYDQGTSNQQAQQSFQECPKERRTSSKFTDCTMPLSECDIQNNEDSSLPECRLERRTPYQFVDCSISQGCSSGLSN